jgi:hypothetical protein
MTKFMNMFLFGREIVDIGAQCLSNFKAFVAASIGSFLF